MTQTVRSNPEPSTVNDEVALDIDPDRLCIRILDQQHRFNSVIEMQQFLNRFWAQALPAA